MTHSSLVIHPVVLRALQEGAPVVALESTLISHGMPYPSNMETAMALEEVIKSHGATPATIAILDGKIKIGLSKEEIHLIGSQAHQVVKVSRHDIPYILVQKKFGATTVAATMFCAQLAGIRIFATGGIGGVHREGEKTMDISADLYELARTDVAVVCAGVKAILDIPKTLEVLETLGVPVLGYKTEDFPAFFCRRSGIKVESSVNDIKELAQILLTKWTLGLQGGVLIANPIPGEEALDEDEMEGIISSAVQNARREGITGKRITPYLLREIVKRTEGRSLKANIALIKNNAALAARLAVEYAQLSKTRRH